MPESAQSADTSTNAEPDADGYAVDVVLCLDVTYSMRPVLEEVKEGALSFHSRLESAMVRRGMPVAVMRVRVVAYRDFGADEKNAILVTPFHPVPAEGDALAGFVRHLQPSGGGDLPESGLEALAVALHSPWTSHNEENGERRHVIALFTDAPAHPLGKHFPGLTPVLGEPKPAPPAAPKRRFWQRPSPAPAPVPPSGDGYGGESYPRTMDELHDQWGREGRDGARIDQSAKRLLLFAPDETPWREIAETWDKTLFVPSTAGTGLEEIALDEVIATIARSL